jgi:hypothetical protein
MGVRAGSCSCGEHSSLILVNNMLNNIEKIEFDKGNLFVYTGNNEKFSQPLSDYPRLERASEEQKSNWKLSNIGIHWEEIDEDISFESFFYDKNDPLIVKMRR